VQLDLAFGVRPTAAGLSPCPGARGWSEPTRAHGRSSLHSTTARSVAATATMVMLLRREAGEMGEQGFVGF